ncbi:MAG: TIGR01212 family radical SAM protein, partial [Chromatiales bacterium]|nr:TIGR01212 family radical SAM protein [Chromatiales bacterium]
HTLERVNRGHTFEEYAEAVCRVRERNIPLCTHLIIGLPGEDPAHNLISLERVLELGVEGLKLHPLHVVKGTALANEWRKDEYAPWSMDSYIRVAADMVERTPKDVIYHRTTGTASESILLAPEWCQWKWKVLNGIEDELARRGSYQGWQLEPNKAVNVTNSHEV